MPEGRPGQGPLLQCTRWAFKRATGWHVLLTWYHHVLFTCCGNSTALSFPGDPCPPTLTSPASAPRAHALELTSLGSQTKLFQNEGVVYRCLTQVFVAIRCREVPGDHVHLQQHQIVVGLEVSQFGHPLRRFPIRHSGVVQACSDEDCRVVLRRHVVYGAVLVHVVVVVPFVGVAPLLPLKNRQGDGRVPHCAHDVHEGYAGQCHFAQIGPHVDDRTNQKPSRAAAVDRHLIRSRPLL
mmetsp:Transcript_8006/g.15537  ORF Transcript_8006/g.15537 Transcript_8006/m.15537 type:complete len:238 (-) Transcript_8006:1892-2605(-)